MEGEDDLDFEALMRHQGVAPLEDDGQSPPRKRAKTPSGRARAKRRAAAERSGASQARDAASPRDDASPRDGLRETLAALQQERSSAREVLANARQQREASQEAMASSYDKLDAATKAIVNAHHQRDSAREALTSAKDELDSARASLLRARAERNALAKKQDALKKLLSRRAEPSLREAIAERGVDDDDAVTVLLELLAHDPYGMLEELRALPSFVQRLHTKIALVCTTPECQPEGSVSVVHVPRERCDVCGGSDIRAAFEGLLRRSRIAGITRLVVVGGSPAYHTQLRALCRGTDLKIDLVSGHRKPGRRRARNEAERVVIWGATILDHGTTAAYDHLGDRLIRVHHRGICRMLEQVAQALG